MIAFLPVGNETPCTRTPWVNRTLIVLNIAIFLLVALRPDYPELVQTWGFKASNPTLITVFTAAFLHGGWMHLVGNMLYLGVVGASVEDRLGHLGYALFYAGGALLAAAVHTFAIPEQFQGMPCIGASGAVAATLGAYLLLFPTQKIRHWGWFIFRPVTFRLPAWLTLGWWFALQAWEQLDSAGNSGVAYGAHIGGFIAGFTLVGLLAISNVVTPSWSTSAAAGLPKSGASPASRTPCPQCEGLMEQVGKGTARCIVCAGTWCDPGQLETLTTARQLPQSLQRRTLEGTPTENQTGCPACAQNLLDIEAHGVSVRACSACYGTFVGNGDLEKIRSAS